MRGTASAHRILGSWDFGTIANAMNSGSSKKTATKLTKHYAHSKKIIEKITRKDPPAEFFQIAFYKRQPHQNFLA